MQNATNTGAICAVSQPVNPTTHSTTTLQRLYTNNFSHIQSEASADGLYVEDVDRLVTAANARLKDYHGAEDDESFCEWITATVKPAALRLSSFYQMKSEHRKVVLKAIWSVITDCHDLGADLGDEKAPSSTVNEIATLTWMKVFLDFERWLAVGYGNDGRNAAKLSTRLYEFARLQAMGWRTDRVRKRKNYVGLDHLEKLEQGRAIAAKGKLPPKPTKLGDGDVEAYAPFDKDSQTPLAPWDVPLADELFEKTENTLSKVA